MSLVYCKKRDATFLRKFYGDWQEFKDGSLVDDNIPHDEMKHILEEINGC